MGGPWPDREHELPISEALKDRIRAWFNASLEKGWRRADWPTLQRPPKRVPGGWWKVETEALCAALADELGPGYLVDYQL